MKKSRVSLIVMSCIALLGLGWAQLAAAQPDPLAPNQIRVTGTVPAMRYIVMDSEGNMQDFFSNTDKSVIPIVSIGSLNGSAAPFTPVLRAQYAYVVQSLQANKVVTVRAKRSSTSVDYPNFIRLYRTRIFTVSPTKMRGDETATPYEVVLP